jgi:predicted porin
MKKLLLATLLAGMYSTANAGIVIPAGDWTLDISGVVNAYYTNTRGTGDAVVGGLGGPNASGERNESNITTGLLPNYLAVSGKSRQNDLDIAFTISINPGASTVAGGDQGANQENRQAFMTIGDASWGSVKLGKDLGIFASDAILNDMTLLGVGSGAGLLAGNPTTLGRIGTGFMYADWKSQVAYTSPNFDGFQFTAGVTQAWNAQSADLNATSAVTNASATSTGRGGAQPAFEGKASYAWTGPVAGKVWTSAISQKVEGLTGANADDRAYAWDVGTNLNAGPYGLTAYYYDGKGIGRTIQLVDGFDTTGKRRDSNGGYVQATYTLPTTTKLGVSYGQSKLDRNSGETATALVEKNEMWTVGAYHPLTKSVNLVAEYSDVKAEAQNGAEGKSRTVSAGAILFF